MELPPGKSRSNSPHYTQEHVLLLQFPVLVMGSGYLVVKVPANIQGGPGKYLLNIGVERESPPLPPLIFFPSCHVWP